MKGKRKKIVLFDEQHPHYGAFCNEAPYAIRISEFTWPTVRHYLLSRQYPAIPSERIRQIGTIPQIIDLIQTEDSPESAKWDVVRDDHLEAALRAKFSQHLDLESRLYRTAEARLVYTSREDSYYGIGPDGQGHNMFGRILMRVRGRLSANAARYFEQNYRNPQLEALEESVRETPADLGLLHELAQHYLRTGLPERASATAYLAVSLDPENAWSRVLLSRALLNRNLHREAVEHLRFLVRLDAEEPVYLQWLAEAYRAIGRDIAAKVLESRARRLNTNRKQFDDE